MRLSDVLVEPWLWAAWLPFLAGLAVAARRAPWRRLRGSEALHVFLGATVAVLILWQIRVDLGPGVHYHLLCVTALTLTLGAPLALVSVTLTQFADALNGGAPWLGLAADVLVNGLVPILASLAVLRLVERILPRHFFVYIFVGAFAGGAVSVLASRLFAAGWMAAGAATPDAAAYTLDFLVLALFPEAFLNGGLMTLAVVYRPGWVTSFDDARYLRGR